MLCNNPRPGSTALQIASSVAINPQAGACAFACSRCWPEKLSYDRQYYLQGR